MARVLAELVPVTEADIFHYRGMQYAAFRPLQQRYRDGDSSPAAETPESILHSMLDPHSELLFIRVNGKDVGGMKTTRKHRGRYRLCRLFILPAHQRQGIASAAIEQMEARYPQAASWELDTILQEKGNCRLYRRMGYRWTGHATICSPEKTLIDFIKILPKE